MTTYIDRITKASLYDEFIDIINTSISDAVYKDQLVCIIKDYGIKSAPVMRHISDGMTSDPPIVPRGFFSKLMDLHNKLGQFEGIVPVGQVKTITHEQSCNIKRDAKLGLTQEQIQITREIKTLKMNLKELKDTKSSIMIARNSLRDQMSTWINDWIRFRFISKYGKFLVEVSTSDGTDDVFYKIVYDGSGNVRFNSDEAFKIKSIRYTWKIESDQLKAKTKQVNNEIKLIKGKLNQLRSNL